MLTQDKIQMIYFYWSSNTKFSMLAILKVHINIPDTKS